MLKTADRRDFTRVNEVHARQDNCVDLVDKGQ